MDLLNSYSNSANHKYNRVYSSNGSLDFEAVISQLRKGSLTYSKVWELSASLCLKTHFKEPPCLLPLDFCKTSPVRPTTELGTLLKKSCPSIELYKEFRSLRIENTENSPLVTRVMNASSTSHTNSPKVMIRKEYEQENDDFQGEKHIVIPERKKMTRGSVNHHAASKNARFFQDTFSNSQLAFPNYYQKRYEPSTSLVLIEKINLSQIFSDAPTEDEKRFEIFISTLPQTGDCRVAGVLADKLRESVDFLAQVIKNYVRECNFCSRGDSMCICLG